MRMFCAATARGTAGARQGWQEACPRAPADLPQRLAREVRIRAAARNSQALIRIRMS
jgi:hypothetical protein